MFAHRRCVLLPALILSLCVTQPCSAQVKCPDEVERGYVIPLEISAPIPVDTVIDIDWSTDKDAHITVIDEGRRAFAASDVSGTHVWTLRTIRYVPPSKEGEKGTLEKKEWTGETKIKGKTPTPGPEPKPQTLAELAGDDRVDIGTRVAAVSAAVKSELVPVDEFQDFLAGKLAKWDGNKAIPVIIGRLENVTDVASIVVELDTIVGELGGSPIPPDAPLTGISALVPNAAHRVQLAEFFTDMATAVRADTYETTGHFRAGQIESIQKAQAAGTLPTGLAAINQPISDKIVAAIGLDDVALVGIKQTSLAQVLDGIAEDFRKGR